MGRLIHMTIPIAPKKKRAHTLVSIIVVAIVISSSLYFGAGLLSSNLSQHGQRNAGIQNQLTSLWTQSPVNGSFAGYVEWTLLLNNNTLINGNYQGNESRTAPGPLIYDPLNGLVYVAYHFTGNVSVVNSRTNRVEFNISGLGSPAGFALDTSDNYLYVANGASVSIINASSNRYVGNITVGTLIGGITLDPSNHNLYVTESGTGNVSVLNTKTESIVTNISVGEYPGAISYNPMNGYVYVGHSLPIIIAGPATQYESNRYAVSLSYNNSSNVVVINSRTERVIQNVSVGSHITSISCSSTTGVVYVADAYGYIVALNRTNNSIISNISTGENPYGISFDPSNGYMYVTSFPFIGGTVVTNNTTRNTYRNYSYLFVFNTSSSQLVSKILTGMAPDEIAYAPSNGRLYVSDGYDGAISIVSTLPEYPVDFRESGLPSGTAWSVTLEGSNTTSNNSTITYSVSNGTYPYTIRTIQNFSSTPSSGEVTVNGSSVNVPIEFSNSTFTVTFTQTGLPNGGEPHNQYVWYVNLSNGGSFSPLLFGWDRTRFNEINGSYSYTIQPVNGYVPIPASGNFTVNGSSVNISVTFKHPPGYQVNFTEVGIPYYASLPYWQITVGNLTVSPGVNSTYLSFYLPEGNYTYSATTFYVNDQYTAFPSSANFSVRGDENITVHFEQYWSVTFSESGLPKDYRWTATLNNVSQGNESQNIVFNEYSQYNDSISVSALAKGYQAIEIGIDTSHISNSEGWNQWSITVYYDFMKAYKLTIVENGLPNGTRWNITLNNIREAFSNTTTILPNNITETSVDSTVNVNITNGSFSYIVGAIAGFRTTQYSGNVQVNGNSVRLEVNWTMVTYPITITQHGIPNGTKWSITITGTNFIGQTVNLTEVSSTDTLKLSLPNGTYHLGVHLPSGYQRNGHLAAIIGLPVAGSPHNVSFSVTHKTDYLLYAMIAIVAIIAVTGIVVSLTVRDRKK